MNSSVLSGKVKCVENPPKKTGAERGRNFAVWLQDTKKVGGIQGNLTENPREKQQKTAALRNTPTFCCSGSLSAGWQGGLADAAVQENTDAFLSGEKHPAPFRSGAGCYKASKKWEQMAQRAIKKIQGWQDSAG